MRRAPAPERAARRVGATGPATSAAARRPSSSPARSRSSRRRSPAPATRDRRVRVAGAGHSFSDIALTDGVQLRLDRLTRVLDVDRSSGLVRVQAGITIRELNARLAAHGLALENLGDIDVAEHRRRDLHRDARHRRAPAQHLRAGGGADARARRRLDAALRRQEPTPTSSAPRASRLGALGVIAEVTLRCVPAFRSTDATGPRRCRRRSRASRSSRSPTTTSSSTSSRTRTPR